MKRRQFVATALATAAWAQLPRAARAESDGRVTVDVHIRKPLHRVPGDFTGLSYESAQLANPKYFSAENASLVALFKLLSPTGVLRIGGNTSSQTRWSATDAAAPTADQVANPATTTAFSWDKSAPEYVVTPAAIRKLRGFLDATGWRLIYGLNLENGTPEAAAEEAACVANTMGEKLVALQFGNEPDLFRNDDATHSQWTYEQYAQKWLQFEKAVRGKLPTVPLAGPDVAFKMEWVTKFAQQMRGKVTLLTGHYYIGGPPSNPEMTIAAILSPPKHLLEEIPQAQAAAKVAGVPYRMAEGNSIYQGGKAGVSDTFASALWAGDYMLQLASAGYCGVNLHGGGHGIYTPIATAADGTSSARPEFYGMLLAQMFAGATLVECDLKAGGENVTAYAGVKDGKVMLAVFNKGARPIELRTKLWDPQDTSEPELWWLRAPAVETKAGVTFAGSSVKGGAFSPNPALVEKPVRVTVAPYSAVLVLG